MKKVIIISLLLPLLAGSISACSRRQDKASQTASSSAVDSSTATVELAADQLTPEQTAALVLYYGDAHLAGAKQNDYSANMEKEGQGATVRIYDIGAVPRGEGPRKANYPTGAQELFSIRLTKGTSLQGQRVNFLYYTQIKGKIYFADNNGGFNETGVTPAAMLAYAKTHGEVSRVTNVAKNTHIIDLRGKVKVTAADGLTTQQLGILAAMNQQPSWFEPAITAGKVYYGEDYPEGEVAGYQFITANGGLSTYLWFKRDGDQVTIKMVAPESEIDQGEVRLQTRKITVDQLLRNYYTDRSQRESVNRYAGQLQPLG